MKKTLKHFMPLLIAPLLAILFFHQGIRWHDLKTVLHQAQGGWLLLALGWQAGSYGAVTWLNGILLQQYGISVPFAKQYVIQLAMAFIESVVPSATISGVVLRARLLKSHGVSPDVSTVTTLVEMALVSASVALLALPIIGIAMLHGTQGLNLAGQGTMALIGVGVLAAIVVWQWRHPRFARFRQLAFQRAAHLWDDHIRSRWPRQLGSWPSERIHRRGRYLLAELAPVLRSQPAPIAASLLARIGFETLGLAMCFLSLGQTLPWTKMLLIYILTLVVNALGAIPGAIGLAEISLAALYTQFGVPSETALVIALTWRLTDYWLPRLIGGITWLWLEKKTPRCLSETI